MTAHGSMTWTVADALLPLLQELLLSHLNYET